MDLFWKEITFLKVFHAVMCILYICNAFAFKDLISQLFIWSEDI